MSKEIAKDEAKILAWLYMVEVCGENQAAESLKKDVPHSLREWSRRHEMENLTRTYEAARQQSKTPRFYWE